MLPNIIQQVIMTVRSKEPFKCYATRGNAVGVGGVSAFSEKSVTNVYGSTLLALRGVGWGRVGVPYQEKNVT